LAMYNESTGKTINTRESRRKIILWNSGRGKLLQFSTISFELLNHQNEESKAMSYKTHFLGQWFSFWVADYKPGAWPSTLWMVTPGTETQQPCPSAYS
jgi:hypothetical protein